MTTRIRSRIIRTTSPGLYTKHLTDETFAGSARDFMENSTDVADQYGLDHDFDLNRHECRQLVPIEGKAYNLNGTPAVTFEKFLHGGTSAAPTHQILPSPPANGVVMAKVLALSNPSRPVVDLPVFVKELRELPQLVQLAGKKLLKRGAGAYLTYEFGWKPLIGDLQKLVNFSDHFAKRERVLRSIFEGGGVKRRVDYEDQTFTSQGPQTIFSNGATLRAVRYYVTRRRIWGTTKWVPDSTKLPPRTDREYRNLARRAVLGLDITPGTLWEAMPWSWLIDWYGSMGDYLNAHRNTVPAVHQRGNVMTQTETYMTYVREPGIDSHTTSAPGGDFQSYYVTKRRRVVNNPTIAAYYPFMSLRQVSILGALSVLRGTRR